MSYRSEHFPAVCTNDQARNYFKDKGLTYDNINDGDILVLVMMCQQELKKSCKAGETSTSTMRLSEKIDMKRKTNGSIVSCFLYMNSHYFTRREAISFNQNGFIGFAGWADQGNTNPLLRAFLRWCDYLTEDNKFGNIFDPDGDVKALVGVEKAVSGSD